MRTCRVVAVCWIGLLAAGCASKAATTAPMGDAAIRHHDASVRDVTNAISDAVLADGTAADHSSRVLDATADARVDAVRDGTDDSRARPRDAKVPMFDGPGYYFPPCPCPVGEYCLVGTADGAWYPNGCRHDPDACVAQPSCACFVDAHVGGFCEQDGSVISVVELQ